MHQLRLLLVLAEELHFGRAAARLFITQPALSRQIQALEQRLGTAMLKRSTHRVELSTAGEMLLPKARAIVEAVDDLRRSADRAARHFLRHVELGSFEANSALPQTRAVLDAFCARHPHVGLRMRTLDLVSQTRALLDGDVDAAFCYLPVPEGIQAQPLASEPRVVCVAEHHPLASRGTLAPHDLAGQSMIGMARAVAPVWRDFWSITSRPGDGPVHQTSHQAKGIEEALSAVSMGSGIWLAPAAARTLYPRPGIRYLDVSGVPPCVSALVWPTASRDEPAVVQLRRVARAVAEHPARNPE